MKKNLKNLIEEFGHRAVDLKEFQVDFEHVSERLKKYHINLESRSLKRLWGYMTMTEKPSRKVLDRLSLFAGFQDWNELQHAFMGK